MLAILNSLNAHNFPIFELILVILVSKFMVHRALSNKTYLSLGLLSPLTPYLHSVGEQVVDGNFSFMLNDDKLLYNLISTMFI